MKGLEKNLDQLRVIHLPKSSGGTAAGGALAQKILQAHSNAFALETCQRWIWVSTHREVDNAYSSLEHFSGARAYAFLLQVTTGLESVIAGEADVFGQFKQAWTQASASLKQSRELAFWMQRLFEDTKEIRTHYLQHLGVSSYGATVRKLVNQRFPKQPRQIVLLGSGLLARSIAPYFLDEKILPDSDRLWVWNRSAEGLEEFKKELPAELLSGTSLRLLESGEEGLKSLALLSEKIPQIVVYCIPAKAHATEESFASLKRADLLLHLGGCRGDFSPALQKDSRFLALDDLLKEQEERSEIRRQKLKRARAACEERAQLRALGHSLSIAHGWEDLAVFASGR